MPSMFPDDSWTLKTLELSLELNETDSGKIIYKLKNEASNRKGFVNLSTKEDVDFPKVYAYLNQSSTNTVIKSGTWNEDEFFRDGKKIGYVGFVIPETTIAQIHDSSKYSIYVSSSGFIRANIMMHSGGVGKEIPEEEYRTIFREMFENLGLPAEKVDEFTFNYIPSMW